MNNPINKYDPSGHIAISTLLIIMGAITVGLTITGATMGGIAAGMSGGDGCDVAAGIMMGAVNGFLIGSSISLIACGLRVGGKTNLGSMMTSYGISTLANYLEVGITQAMKSSSEGLSFWNIANNVNKAIFRNSGAVITGQVPLIPIDIYGTRLVTKGMFLVNAFIKYDIDKLFGAKGIPYSLYAMSELFQDASKASLLLSYGITFATVTTSIIRVCMQDYENSPWILY